MDKTKVGRGNIHSVKVLPTVFQIEEEEKAKSEDEEKMEVDEETKKKEVHGKFQMFEHSLLP